jgi:hypothetical protein
MPSDMFAIILSFAYLPAATLLCAGIFCFDYFAVFVMTKPMFGAIL